MGGRENGWRKDKDYDRGNKTLGWKRAWTSDLEGDFRLDS